MTSSQWTISALLTTLLLGAAHSTKLWEVEQVWACPRFLITTSLMYQLETPSISARCKTQAISTSHPCTWTSKSPRRTKTTWTVAMFPLTTLATMQNRLVRKSSLASMPEKNSHRHPTCTYYEIISLTIVNLLKHFYITTHSRNAARRYGLVNNTAHYHTSEVLNDFIM